MQVTDYWVYAAVLAVQAASGVLCIRWLRDAWLHGWTKPVVPHRPVPWRLHEAVGVVIANLLCVWALMQQLFQISEAAPITLRHLQMLCACEGLVVVTIPLTLSLWCRSQWADFGIRADGIWDDVKFGVWGGLVSQVPIYLISWPLQSLREAQPHEMLGTLKAFSGDWQALAWIMALTVVIVPMLEELLFRVLMQGALERDVSPVWAIGLTAAAFVFIHKWVDWLPLVPLALILGYCYYRRRSYLTVVLVHGLSNGLAIFYAIWGASGAGNGP